MAKFYGPVGFIVTTEVRTGVFVEQPSERNYAGEILRRNIRYENGQSVNDNITTSNQISIVADPYAHENCYKIKYVKWRGDYWDVTSVDASQYPRLILSLGGVYNGNRAV